jgi:hypothetical protein
MKEKEDPEAYKAIVLNCLLYVKVAKMSDVIYRQIESSYAKQPIKYQFRKFVAKELTVPVLNSDFITGNLFPDSEIPCKLHFALVNTLSKNGDMRTNPFQFYRKYQFPKKDSTQLLANRAHEIENHCMYERLEVMHSEHREMFMQHKQLLAVIENLVKSTQGGGGSQTTEPPLAPSAPSGSQTVNDEDEEDDPLRASGSGVRTRSGKGPGPKKGRFQESDGRSERSAYFSTQGTQGSQIEPTTAFTIPTLPDLDNPIQQLSQREFRRELEAEIVKVWIKSFELDINSAPLDQVKFFLN